MLKLSSILLLISLTAFGQIRRPNNLFKPAVVSGGGSTHSIIGTNISTELDGLTNGIRRASVTAGNMLIVCTKWEVTDSATLTVTNSSGDTFTSLLQTNTPDSSAFCQIAYAKNVTGGANVDIIAKWSSTVFACDVVVIEVAGCSTSAPMDVQGIGSGTGTAASTGNFTTAQAEEILVTVIARSNPGTVTPQASWTEVTDQNAIEVQHFITSTSGSYQGAGTISGSQVWAETAAAFK